MTDPRIAVLSALSSPGWHPVPEAHGMPWEEAEELLAAYDASRAAPVLPAPAARAAILREAAEVAVRAARGCGDSETGQYAASVAAGIGKELRRVAGEAQQPKICELPHLTIAEEDACEQHRLGDQAQQPETQAADEPPCTCAAAGDCFAPAGHYADCPAAVSQPGKEA